MCTVGGSRGTASYVVEDTGPEFVKPQWARRWAWSPQPHNCLGLLPSAGLLSLAKTRMLRPGAVTPRLHGWCVLTPTCCPPLHSRRAVCFLSVNSFHTHIPKYSPVLIYLAKKVCGERHQTGNEMAVIAAVCVSCFLLASSGVVHLPCLAWQ